MKKERGGLMLMQLKKTPIVQVACEKTGISRATITDGEKRILSLQIRQI